MRLLQGLRPLLMTHLGAGGRDLDFLATANRDYPNPLINERATVLWISAVCDNSADAASLNICSDINFDDSFAISASIIVDFDDA